MTDWTVKPEDERPARPDGTCFYCSQPIGGRHHPDCVIPQKEVVITFEVRLRMTVPHGWDEDRALFQYGESSWCANNFVGMLEAARKGREKQGICLCGTVQAVRMEEVP